METTRTLPARGAGPLRAYRQIVVDLIRSPGMSTVARRVSIVVRPLSAITGLGWTVLVGSLVAWALGVRLGWIEALFAAATGLLVFALCTLFTIGRTTLRITLTPQPSRMSVGESTEVALAVTNLARQPLVLLAMEIAIGAENRPFQLPLRLAGHGGIYTTHFPVRGERRGVIAIGPATTVRGDPLGLLRRRVSWTGVNEVFVYPRTTPLEPFSSGLLRDLEGRTTDEVSMSDLAFHALREYVPGDDRRYIHWRSSAKVASAVPGGSFLVRQFQDTRRTHALIVVDGDATSYPDPDDFETAISVGASLALRAAEDSLDTTLIVADQREDRHSGRPPTRNRVLDTCARAQFGGGNLAVLVACGVRTAPGATFALIVTGAKPAYGMLRRVAALLPPEVSTTIIRVDPSVRPGLSSVSAPTVLTLGTVDDLRPTLRRGGAR